MSNQQFDEISGGGTNRISFSADSVQPSSGSIVGPLHHLIEVWFRFCFRSILFFVVAMSAVVAALIYWPREYTSEAKLFLRVGRGANVTLDPTVSKGPGAPAVAAARESEINTVLELMGSRAIREQLFDAIGSDPPHKTPEERDKAIIKLGKTVTIWSPTESNVVCVAAQAKSPQRAQQTVEKLVEIFMDEYLRVNSTPGSYEFFEEQASATKEQLRLQSAELQETKSRFALASVQGRRTVLETQIGLIEQQRNLNESTLLATQAKIAALTGELKDVPDELVKEFAAALPEVAANSKRQQLYELQKREQQLASKYAQNHPELVAIQKQIQVAQETLASEQPDRAQATSGVLLTELVNEKGLLASKESLAGQYERIHGELKDLNRHEVRIVELERNIGILEAKYQTYVENLEQSRIDRELEQFEITNINIVQPATLRLKPTSPNKAMTLIFGFLAAAFGAMALPYVADQLDTTLQSIHQVEQCLGTPVLLAVPRTKRSPMITFRDHYEHDHA